MTTPSRLRSGSTANYLRSIADGDLTAPQAITRTLTNALAANDYSDCIRDLPGIDIDPQAYIDSLDRVRPCLSLSSVALHSYSLRISGDKYPFKRIRHSRTMRPSAGQGLWNIRSSSGLTQCQINPHEGPTPNRVWWILRNLEGYE